MAFKICILMKFEKLYVISKYNNFSSSHELTKFGAEYNKKYIYADSYVLFCIINKDYIFNLKANV